MYHIWCLTPLFLLVQIFCGGCKRCIQPILECCILPVVHPCSWLCVHFRTDGVDYDALMNPKLPVPVKKAPKPKPVAPPPTKKETVVLVEEIEPEDERNVYLGDKTKMQKSIGRQMML